MAENVDYVYNLDPHGPVPGQDMTMAEVDGQWRTYCHKECQWTDQTAFRPTFMGRETPNMGS